MRSTLQTSIIVFFILFGCSLMAQQVTQTIRGTVTDRDTRMPLPGANVVEIGSGLGATSDGEGHFRIEKVPVGRANIRVSFIGYEDRNLPNLLVNSATEVVLTVELTEAVNTLDEVVVKAGMDKSRPINEMAVVSARTFSVEETKRYAGAIDDPARMVSAFAGVTNDPAGNNDIIVRGNSPRGILWRLEGVEIPNPNHFADEGGTGGPINALNSAMLGNSDFYTGAFAPQYGNALSAVFDMNLRTGNNQEREYSFQASTLGLDLTAEGPFSQNYNGSFLANYRYSSLALLDAAGIVDFDGVPRYQDASFKVMLPLNGKHSLSLFGLGGISGILQEETDPDDETLVLSRADVIAKMGVAGVAHTFLINEKAYLKTNLTASGTGSYVFYEEDHGSRGFEEDYSEDFLKKNLGVSSTFHYKANARNKFKVGAIYTHMGYSLSSRNFEEDRNRMETLLSQDGTTGSLQGFVEWKHRLNERFSLVGGAHYLQLLLNNNLAVEPRLAAEWQLDEKQTLTAGAGLHSKLETVAIYQARQTFDDGTSNRPNQNLDLSRSAHFVVGYGRRLGAYSNLKLETYYQHLYNIPVENKAGSYQSVLNYSSGYTNQALVNEGSGRNYGLELTLERYLHRGFYWLGTLSLYQSLYTAKDGVERNSAFDGRYVVNGLAGKEFKMGKEEKHRTFFVNTRVALIGAKPYTPVDVDESIARQTTVLDDSRPFGVRGDDVFKWDLAIGIRRNHKKVTTEWKIDVQNLTNNQAVLNSYFSTYTQSLEHSYQLAMFPTLSWRVTF